MICEKNPDERIARFGQTYRLLRPLLLLSLISPLAGCSWLFGDTFHNRANDYVYAEQADPMQVPEGIGAPNTEDFFPIPPGQRFVWPEDEEAQEAILDTPRPLPLSIPEEQTVVVSLRDEQNRIVLNAALETDGNGYPILRMNRDFNNAWLLLGDALREASISIRDLNRTLGVYYVAYTGVTDDQVDSAAEEQDADARARDWDYELKVNRARNSVYVSVLKDAETLAEQGVSETLLELLQDKLKQIARN